MPNQKPEAVILQLRSILADLTELKKSPATGSPDGASWLRDRMLKRAAENVTKAIGELESYMRSDQDLDAFGSNLRFLEEHTD